MPVGDVFLWVANRKLTVTIKMVLGQFDRKFIVRDGTVVQAAASDPREYLGQHLINFGYIGEDQLQKAFDTQKETHVPLGRVLVMVDAVTQDQLHRVLLFKTRESLLEAMVWSEGSFTITTEVPDADLDGEIPVSLLEVHSEGVARARMWGEMRRVFPTDATRCDVLVDPGDKASAFDRRLIEFLREGRSIGEAGLELRAMDFQIYARLYDLFNRKVIRPRTVQIASPSSDELPADEALVAAETSDDAIDIDEIGAEVEVPEPKRTLRKGGEYSKVSAADDESWGSDEPDIEIVIRPEAPEEAPGVAVPDEAADPASAMRIALAGRNWGEALLLAERILQMDPNNAEAVAARRVAEGQVRKLEAEGAGSEIELSSVPTLAIPKTQVAQGHLTSKERYVLSRIDGRRTLAQIAAVSPIQRTELVRIVESFANRGVVDLKS
jgi:hypothetical protein